MDNMQLKFTEYFPNLPDGAIKVGTYNGFEYDLYWWDVTTNRLIVKCTRNYKFVNMMRPKHAKNSLKVNMVDKKGRNHS